MAIDVRCVCGTPHSLPDQEAGRLARCGHCGRSILIPGVELGSDPLPLDESSPPSSDAKLTGPQQERQALQSLRPAAPRGLTAPPQVVIESTTGFWGEVLGAFFHFSTLEGVAAFLFAWFLNVLAGGMFMLSLIGINMGAGRMVIFVIFALFVYGYLSSFYMNCVTHAASGERGLPLFTFSADWVEDILVPMGQWWGSMLFVQVPTILAAILLISFDAPDDVQQGFILLLTCLGWFFWPMCILTVALGGFSMLVRFDRVVTAIFNSPGPYLLLCGLLILAMSPILGLRYLTDLYAYPTTYAEMFGIYGIPVRSLLLGLESYCILICVRLVGVYYQHFKSDFPWALG